MKITLDDILDTTDGKSVGSFQDSTVTITALVMDSRHSRSHAIFIPFKGDNNNGYDFIDDALDRGCAGCSIDHELSSYAEGKCYILLNNILETIWKIARLWLSRLKGTKVICVTGSAGKTTTTRMIASVIHLGALVLTNGVTTYGIRLNNDVHPQEHLAFLSKHLMHSAIATFAVGSYVGLSKDEIIDGIKAFTPATRRMNFISCYRFLLIDSSFNANPASMKMAIGTLSGYAGTWVILETTPS